MKPILQRLFLSLCILASACGPSAPLFSSFTLSLSSSTLSVAQNGSNTLNLTLTPQNGFSGTVSLSLVGVPSGLTLSPSSLILGGTALTQAITISADPTVALNTYDLKLKASSGTVSQEIPLKVTVTPAAPAANFTLSLSTSSVSVAQGGSGNLSLTLTPQNGFTGTVNLGLVNAPAGLNLSPSSVTVGNNPLTQTLTLTADATLATNAYDLKVKASSAGIAQESDLKVTVTNAPGFSLTLDKGSLSVWSEPFGLDHG